MQWESSVFEAMKANDGSLQVSPMVVLSLNELKVQKCVGTFELYANVR